MHIYAPFGKVEDEDDGTIRVYGIASSEAVDSDEEIVRASAIQAAIPDYMKFGAVREMHQPLAAGTALQIAVNDEGVTTFGAHIIDPVAVKKVKLGAYKGFSIGGKVTARDTMNPRVITGLKLVEVSLVDRPANPDAIMQMWKAETPMTAPTILKQAWTCPHPLHSHVSKADALKCLGETPEAERSEEARALKMAALAKASPAPDHAASDGLVIDGAKATEGEDHQTTVSVSTQDATAGAATAELKPSGGTGGGDPGATGAQAKKDPTDGGPVGVEVEAAPAKVPQSDNSKDAAERAAVLKAIADAIGKLPDDAVTALHQIIGSVEKGETLEVTNKTAATATVRLSRVTKGMYSIAQLAALIDELDWLHMCVMDEAAWEGDNSALPDQIKANLAALCETLRSMVGEETAELTEAVKAVSAKLDVLKVAPAAAAATADTSKAVEKPAEAAEDDGVAKAGARHNKADLKRVQTLHDSSVELGAKCAVDHGATVTQLDGKAAGGDDLAKAHTGALAKVAQLEGDLAKAQARVVELEAMPAPAKGKLVFIEKGQEIEEPNPLAEEFQKARDSDKPIDMFRFLQKLPQTVVLRK